MAGFFESGFGKSLLDWAGSRGLPALLLALGAFLAVRVARSFLRRFEKKLAPPGEPAVSERAKRAKAMVSILSHLVTAVIYIAVGIAILDRLGINTGSLIASVGVIGLALGFGAQSLAKDLISGMFILVENQFGVGDTIRVQATGLGTITGSVERMTLRATILRGNAGEAQIVPNGEIRVVSNLSKEWAKSVIDVPIPADQTRAAIEILEEVLVKAGKDLGDDLLAGPELLGVEELGMDEATLRISARVEPLKQWEVSRELRRRAVEALAAAGVVSQNRADSGDM